MYGMRSVTYIPKMAQTERKNTICNDPMSFESLQTYGFFLKQARDMSGKKRRGKTWKSFPSFVSQVSLPRKMLLIRGPKLGGRWLKSSKYVLFYLVSLLSAIYGDFLVEIFWEIFFPICPVAEWSHVKRLSCPGKKASLVILKKRRPWVRLKDYPRREKSFWRTEI